MAGGTLHDGRTARAHRVTLDWRDGALLLSGEVEETVPIEALRRDAPGLLRDSRRPDWLLKLDAPLDPTMRRAIRSLHAPTRRGVAWTAGLGGAALAVGLLLWLKGDALLELAAPLVPHTLTAPIGEGVVAQLGQRCATPASTAALNRLATRLGAARLPEPLTVTIIDQPIVNALALPGGQVVVFRKLVADAKSPDELAGVLAHEFAHVARRHPNKMLLRQFGVSLFLKSLGGDTAGFADLALLIQTTRAAEGEADRGAIAMLREAAISPVATAAFFDRMGTKSADDSALMKRIGSYAATHPADADRALAFRAAATYRATPAMTPADWQAVRAACG
jgi:Zn-dependent protease with chaperone function